MNASEIMSTEVYVVSPTDNLAMVRNLFQKRGISRVLVYDKKPLGLLTEQDLASIFFEERRPIDEIRVGEVMKRGLLTASAGFSPEQIAKMMCEHNVHGIPILDKGSVEGIVTKSDLANYFMNYYKEKVKVSEIMESGVCTVREFHSIFHAAKLMKEKGVNKLVVMRHKKPVGVITARDIGLASFGSKPSKVVFVRKAEHGPAHKHVHIFPLIVGDLMKEPIYTISQDADAAFGVRVMNEKKVGSLVVKKGEKLVGLLSKHDYVRYLANQA